MARKYHVNNHTGRVGVCRAVKNCPFGDMVTEHYESRELAQSAYEAAMNKHLIKPAVIKDSIKHMDANDLAYEILSRAENNGFSQESFSEILETISILHAEQRRRTRVKGQEALYLEHPLRVSLRLMRHGVKDEATIKAALFHDAVEDGSLTFARDFLGNREANEPEAREMLLSYIGATHGEEVKNAVNSVTNAYIPEAKKKVRTVAEKNREYLEHVSHEVKSSPRAMLVKLSDFMDNAGSLHHTDFPGIEDKTKKQAVKYLPVADVFLGELERGNPYLSKEEAKYFTTKLNQAVDRMEQIIEKYQHVS